MIRRAHEIVSLAFAASICGKDVVALCHANALFAADAAVPGIKNGLGLTEYYTWMQREVQQHSDTSMDWKLQVLSKSAARRSRT